MAPFGKEPRPGSLSPTNTASILLVKNRQGLRQETHTPYMKQIKVWKLLKKTFRDWILYFHTTSTVSLSVEVTSTQIPQTHMGCLSPQNAKQNQGNRPILSPLKTLAPNEIKATREKPDDNWGPIPRL